jgi:RimJ/RimL family protein N-acetyltransferase
MEIRRLGPSDANAFQALRLQALRECPSAFASNYEEERNETIAAVSQRMAPAADRGIFGAFSESELIGSIGFGRESLRKRAHKGFIWGMYVVPAFRNQRVGRQLISHVLEFAEPIQGMRQVHLRVNAANSAAIALYEAVGFRSFGLERGAMLIDGELHDEIMMARSFAKGERVP